MTASATVLHAGAASETVVDTEGRRISVRKLTALDKLRLFKAAGPVLAHNEPWLGMAILACSVTAINDIPVPMPASEQQIEGLVARLGDAGLSVIATATFFADPDPSGLVEAAGN